MGDFVAIPDLLDDAATWALARPFGCPHGEAVRLALGRVAESPTPANLEVVLAELKAAAHHLDGEADGEAAERAGELAGALEQHVAGQRRRALPRVIVLGPESDGVAKVKQALGLEIVSTLDEADVCVCVPGPGGFGPDDRPRLTAAARRVGCVVTTDPHCGEYPYVASSSDVVRAWARPSRVDPTEWERAAQRLMRRRQAEMERRLMGILRRAEDDLPAAERALRELDKELPGALAASSGASPAEWVRPGLVAVMAGATAGRLAASVTGAAVTVCTGLAAAVVCGALQARAASLSRRRRRVRVRAAEIRAEIAASPGMLDSRGDGASAWVRRQVHRHGGGAVPVVGGAGSRMR